MLALTLSFKFHFGVPCILLIGALLCGCSTSKSPVAEAPPPTPVAPVSESVQNPKLPAPELVQVKQAVDRVFKDGVSIDSSHRPAFVVGDFNGDASEDLAVVVQPNPAKLSELNEEFPTWIFRDVRGNPDQKSPRLRVGVDDVLLAVIHGFGPSGWRDAQATQTYLLKNAAGTNLEARSAKDSQPANQSNKQPNVRGDVLAQVLDGSAGYLYFSNFSYSWYDPKTFTGEPEKRRGHGDKTAAR